MRAHPAAPTDTQGLVHTGLKPYKDFKILDLFQAPDLQGQLEDEALLPTDFMPYPPFAPCPPDRKEVSRDLCPAGRKQVSGEEPGPPRVCMEEADEADWSGDGWPPSAVPLEAGPAPQPREATGDPECPALPQAAPARPPKPCPAQGHFR